MTASDLNQRIATLAQWMHQAEHLVLFPGAGSSTESGLPDFRGPDGVWTRRDKGLPTKRGDWSAAEPNSGHVAVVELHGNIVRVRCSRCETTVDRSAGFEICDECGGKLVPSVVGFGQTLPQKDLMDSIAHTQKCDLFLVVGSSLVVTPAAGMPRIALQYGARLVIINQGETPFDRATHLRFWENIAEVLPPAVDKLRELVG